MQFNLIILDSFTLGLFMLSSFMVGSGLTLISIGIINFKECKLN